MVYFNKEVGYIRMKHRGYQNTKLTGFYVAGTKVTNPYKISIRRLDPYYTYIVQ